MTDSNRSKRPDAPREIRSLDIIGAIRLALAGAADDKTVVAVVQKLCEYAPSTPADATGPAQLLVDALRDVKGRMVVVGDAP